MTACLFCRIAAGEIPAETVYETRDVVVFKDIAPKAPVHLLAVPVGHYETVSELAAQKPDVAAELFSVVGLAAEEAGLTDGYRLIVNRGEDGGQEVPHVHVHILGGRRLGPMLAG